MNPKTAPECWLTWRPEGQERRLRVSSPHFRVGRSEECLLVLPGNDVSRWHATFALEAGIWVVTDNGSKNGLWVNGRRVFRRELRTGDRVKIGGHELTVEVRRRGVAMQETAYEPAVVDETTGTISARIDMEKLQTALRKETGEHQGLAGGGIQNLIDAEPGKPTVRAEELWVVRLFNEAAEALLSCDGLQPMLEKVIELVFRHLPAERGLIGLAEGPDQAIVPRVSRSLVRGEDQTNIRISRHIRDAAMEAKQAVLVRDAESDSRFSPVASIQLMQIHSAMCAPLYRDGRVEGIVYVDTRSALRAFEESHLHILSTLALLSAVAIEKTRLREVLAREARIREGLSRYFAPAVVDRIIRTSERPGQGLEAEEREATILFADLSGFTAMSEQMEPAEVARILNGAFAELTRAVFDHEGTLDKFMGDGLMAIFGAPLDQPEHAELAVRAALQMQTNLQEFNRKASGNPLLSMRIGINTGMVVAGDLGSPKRKDYTVIGDAVNVASRLESSVATPGQIVVGPETYDRVRHGFHCQPLDEVVLKGKSRSIRPYLILGATEKKAEEEQEEVVVVTPPEPGPSTR